MQFNKVLKALHSQQTENCGSWTQKQSDLHIITTIQVSNILKLYKSTKSSEIKNSTSPHGALSGVHGYLVLVGEL